MGSLEREQGEREINGNNKFTSSPICSLSPCAIR